MYIDSDDSCLEEEDEDDENLINKQKSDESVSEDPPMEEWSSLLLFHRSQLSLQKKLSIHRAGLGTTELCSLYIQMSSSSVREHTYSGYPSVPDPGIEEALLDPIKEPFYPDDGQDKYLAVCNEMNLAPVSVFYNCLKSDVIDLQYYGLSSKGIQAMEKALENNDFVKELNLSDNFLNMDACYHIHSMLSNNRCITKLNLSGCRIGPEGARTVMQGLLQNYHVSTLDLSRNKLDDVGLNYIAESIVEGVRVNKIYLSQNNIGAAGANALADAFKLRNNLSVIDLSWNFLFDPQSMCKLLHILSENDYLRELILSWNTIKGEKIAGGLAKVLKAPNLTHLDVSNNRIAGKALTRIISALQDAQNLQTLDLSNNPLTPEDAVAVIKKLSSAKVKCSKLLMENVNVNLEFLNVLNRIQKLKRKANTTITYGNITGVWDIPEPDIRKIVLKRADFLTSKRKKIENRIDLPLFGQQLLKENVKVMTTQEFTKALIKSGIVLKPDMIAELVQAFPGRSDAKTKRICIRLLVEYAKRLWPERQLPPTPQPECEAETEEAPKTKQKKHKVKKKSKRKR